MSKSIKEITRETTGQPVYEELPVTPPLRRALKALEKWFESEKRILPWRSHPSFYRVWVSEIMLQQTQVVTVIPYFEKFIGRFPTLESLASASLEDVLLHWSGLGYYSRARNLHRGAKELCASMLGSRGGAWPKTREEWLKIPGVGNYTAGAILSIAGNQPEALLDGNVERVISRLKRIGPKEMETHPLKRTQGQSEYKARLWKVSQTLVELAFQLKIKPSLFNQALMELGAKVCTPRQPSCPICPLRTTCEANQTGEQALYPRKKKPVEWIHVKENLSCLINEEREVLLRRRGKSEWRAGLWDLLANEKLGEASGITDGMIGSAIEGDLGGQARGALIVGEVETRHTVTRHKIQRLTRVIRLSRKVSKVNKLNKIKKVSHPTSPEDQELRWVPIRNPNLPMGSALKKTLQKVLDEYPQLF